MLAVRPNIGFGSEFDPYWILRNENDDYIGRTTQKLDVRIKQQVPMKIRN